MMTMNDGGEFMAETDDRQAQINNQAPSLHITWQRQSPAETLVQMGEWLEARRCMSDALEFYQAALLIDPSFSFAGWRGGQLSLKRKDYQTAAQLLEASLRASPDHAPTMYLISVAYSGLERHELALDYANTALKYDSQHVGAFLQKLRSHAALQQWDELKVACHSAPLSAMPAGEVHLWCALASIQKGDLGEAREHYVMINSRVKRQHKQEVVKIEAALH